MLERIWVQIRRHLQFAYYSIFILARVKNWQDYYKDLLNQIKQPWILETTNGLKIILRPNSVDRWSALETLVLKLNRLFLFPNPESYNLIVDVGAHIGDSTIDLANYFKKAKIIAIEPIKESVLLLNKNMVLNGIEKRVEIINAALSPSTKKTVRLYVNQNSAASSTVRKIKTESLLVTNLSLTELGEKVKGKALLKIDIEGGEYDIFTRENIEILKKFNSFIIETHYVSKKENAKLMKKQLNQLGIRKYKKIGRFFYVI